MSIALYILSAFYNDGYNYLRTSSFTGNKFSMCFYTFLFLLRVPGILVNVLWPQCTYPMGKTGSLGGSKTKLCSK